FILLLIISVVFCVVCGVYDVMMTQKGLKAGVAVESNTWLIGDKPSAKALYLRDALLLLFCITPALFFAFVFHNVPLQYAGLVSPVVYGVKHILGGLAWRALL